MDVRQFQDEPVVLPTASRLEPYRPDAKLTEGGRSAGVVSLLLGLGLRDRLSDSDRVFLDQLAPHRCITFLAQNHTYLHPADVTLFPLDVIDATVNQAGDAIFTHHYPAAGDNVTDFRIHTAIINSGEPQPLILGFFGPEHELDRFVAENSFLGLVLDFRRTRRELASLIDSIRQAMTGPVPMVVVNRSSGRILALNAAARESLPAGKDDPVDGELNALKDSFAELVAGTRLEIKNVSAGEAHLSLVRLERGPAVDKSRFVGAFLLHKLKEKGAGFTAAASLMETIAKAKLDPKDVALLQNLVAGSDEFDRLLTRLCLLVAYDSLPLGIVNISHALRRVVDRRNAACDRHLAVAITRDSEDLEVQAPAAAHDCLFDAVLEAHLSQRPGPGLTMISMQRTASGDAVDLAFETDLAHPLTAVRVDPEWSAFAITLAARMGADCGKCFAIDGHRITTELKIRMKP